MTGKQRGWQSHTRNNAHLALAANKGLVSWLFARGTVDTTQKETGLGGKGRPTWALLVRLEYGALVELRRAQQNSKEAQEKEAGVGTGY